MEFYSTLNFSIYRLSGQLKVMLVIQPSEKE